MVFIFYACLFYTAESQKVIGIDSFTYELYDDGGAIYYILKPCFKYDNSDVWCIQDTILRHDPKLIDIFSLTTEISDSLYVKRGCYKYENFEKCIIDSVLFSFPLSQLSQDMNEIDVSSLAHFSEALQKFGEKIMFRADPTVVDAVRFLWYEDTGKVYLYYIENSNENIIANYKEATFTNGKIEALTERNINISKRQFKRIFKYIENSLNCKDTSEFEIMSKDFIVEGYIDGEYFLIHNNIVQIRMFNRWLHKAFSFIKDRG